MTRQSVISAGSFTRRFGSFVFQGNVGAAQLGVVIRPLRDGRFMIHAIHQQRPWIVIVEPDADAKLLVVVTVYEVSG